jgi:competence ComEA-like helix-hairpin-helix protein
VEAREGAAAWLRGQVRALRREAREQAEAEVATSGGKSAQVTASEVERRVEKEARRLEAEAEEMAERAAAEARREAESEIAKLRSERDAALKKLREAERRPAPTAAKPEAAKPEPAQPKAAEKQPARQAKAAAKDEPAKKAPEADEEVELTGPVDLNEATFEQLRALRFSAAQANRVIAYRERLGGYKAIDDLETVPGIQRELVEKLRDRLQV